MVDVHRQLPVTLTGEQLVKHGQRHQIVEGEGGFRAVGPLQIGIVVHQGAQHGKGPSLQLQRFARRQTGDALMVRATGDHIIAAFKGSLVKAAAGEGTVFQHIVQIRPIQPHHNGGVFASLGKAVNARHPVRESGLRLPQGHGLVVGLVVVIHHPLSQLAGGRQQHLPAFQRAHGVNLRAGPQFFHHLLCHTPVVLIVLLVRGRGGGVCDRVIPG